MNSCLYKSTIIHQRKSPKVHAFKYSLFMFYIDLDEIAQLDRSLCLFSLNRLSPYEYRESDHYQNNNRSTKDSILSYLKNQGINREIGKVYLLTHLRSFGHVFNPVSFYFVSDTSGDPLCSIAEVANTFNEQKMYFIPSEETESKQIKNFYVSPFSDLDTQFHFTLKPPTDNLRLTINQSEKQKVFFKSALFGKKVSLTDNKLALYLLRFPAITLSIVFAIHWQAFLLYCKGITVRRKSANRHQQTNTRVYIASKNHPVN
ncbi:DUF1365 domain-containing protein [Puniceicoccaceae bacterium K14]|nr:DUF1365 domain-containing protein [Puniceicoccaceae bacterium K14]